MASAPAACGAVAGPCRTSPRAQCPATAKEAVLEEFTLEDKASHTSGVSPFLGAVAT